MKSTIKIFILFSFFLTLFSASAQAPEKISYQAVVRNASNTLIANQAIGMRVSILQGSANGTEVYKELFNPNPQTNINGLVTVEIGTGIPLTGTFTGINWANGPYFIKTETDPTGGTSYSIVGTSQLLSAPYALYAKSSGNAGWSLNGNTASATNFIGTTNDTDLFLKRNNVNAGRISDENTSFGSGALNPLSSGGSNTAIGGQSLFSNVQGYSNTAVGFISMYANTNGVENTAIGYGSLEYNTTGSLNTANGGNALNSNTTGSNNTANGRSALQYNSTGNDNTAVGLSALYFNTTGSSNTSTGIYALFSNTTGHSNSATGKEALYSNTTGHSNVANGFQALHNNTTTNQNTAIGSEALYSNAAPLNTAVGYRSSFSKTTGFNNTSLGAYSSSENTTGNRNTAIGVQSMQGNTTGSDNTAVGFFALGNNTGFNNIGIGSSATVPSASGSNQVRIGNTSISYAGTQVAWSVTSDNRWKENVQPSNLGLNFINDLRPVYYTRKNDASKKVEYGIIAQELEASLMKFGANTNGIITKDDEGLYSVRYNDLLAPMIQAIQEQQVMIEALKAEIQQLKSK